MYEVSKVHSSLHFHSFLKGMFDCTHFRYKVGNFDKDRMRIATSDTDMFVKRACREYRNDFVNIEILVTTISSTPTTLLPVISGVMSSDSAKARMEEKMEMRLTVKNSNRFTGFSS